jgi:hypothetical protein
MLGLRFCAMFLAAVAGSCRPRMPATIGAEASPPKVSPSRQPVSPAGTSPPEVAPVRFEPVVAEPAAQPPPHVEIVRPLSEQQLAPDKANSYEVGLRVENWSHALVDLSLDDFEPRRGDTLPKKLTLADLVPADRSLDPGQHLLVATAVGKDGTLVHPAQPQSRAPFAAVTFWVGAKSEPRYRADQPLLVYRQPRGTYNGADARVLLDFVVLGADPRLSPAVRILVKGESIAGEHIASKPAALLLSGLGSGDYVVTLELLGPGRVPLDLPQARVGRTITVNRDAPVRP